MTQPLRARAPLKSGLSQGMHFLFLAGQCALLAPKPDAIYNSKGLRLSSEKIWPCVRHAMMKEQSFETLPGQTERDEHRTSQRIQLDSV